MAEFDLAVIGGGINGAGIARDAAGRGLSVLLVEQNDLGWATSSASTKLVHGGLRYLEQGALRLVRESLIEREVLLGLAPHLVRPLRFVMPYRAGLRPAWQLRLGLFVYDHLGGRDLLPGTRVLDLTHGPVAAPLDHRFRSGFEYSDCQVDDSRLVVLTALDAAERGATIRTRTRLVGADRAGADWRLALSERGERLVVTARALVNAAGPWVRQVSEQVLRVPEPAPVILVKGSHVVLPRLFDHDRAYLFQGDDGRVVFAIPYHHDFTLIGTTDEPFAGEPDSVAPSPEEIAYLARMVSWYLRDPVDAHAPVWTFAGVRPLYGAARENPKDVTREYQVVLDAPSRQAPLVTVYGGKITTYRRLAEEVLARLATILSMRPSWTHGAALPGGDFPWDGIEALVARARGLWSFLSESQARRLVAAYGTRIDRVMGSARSFDDLGPRFGPDLTAAEVGYLMRHEWAQTADDVLWRRTKLGLRLRAEEEASLRSFMATTRKAQAAAG
jgi:glycerol-3-phosphate dehydrogenase